MTDLVSIRVTDLERDSGSVLDLATASVAALAPAPAMAMAMDPDRSTAAATAPDPVTGVGPAGAMVAAVASEEATDLIMLATSKRGAPVIYGCRAIASRNVP